MVRNLRIISVLNSEITLAWDAPPESSSEDKEYEIKYFPRGVETAANVVYTKNAQHTIVNLRQRTDYAIQVGLKLFTFRFSRAFLLLHLSKDSLPVFAGKTT